MYRVNKDKPKNNILRLNKLNRDMFLGTVKAKRIINGKKQDRILEMFHDNELSINQIVTHQSKVNEHKVWFRQKG